MNIESPCFLYSKIHLVSSHVTTDSIIIMTHVHIFHKKRSPDFLDVMCVKECIVHRICLLVIGGGGWRQEVLRKGLAAET